MSRLCFSILLTALLGILGPLSAAAQTEGEPAGGAHPFAPMPQEEPGSKFGERIAAYELDIDVKVRINAPGEDAWKTDAPTMLIIYALPNGNTTAWTVGKVPGPGEDWHFDIQNIGAQTRCLRSLMTDRNIVTAYVEAGKRSWPRWRSDRDGGSELILQIVDGIVKDVETLAGEKPEIFLTGHSGGGSFAFGYLNGVQTIPDDVKRIAFLDSNYGFDAEMGHGEKLSEWLRRSDENHLVVLCYDDRDVTYNGKKIVSDTGGTYRASQRMLQAVKADADAFAAEKSGGASAAPEGFAKSETEKYERWIGYGGRFDLAAFKNPDLKILHTVMVGEWNGLIHAAVMGTEYEPEALYIDQGRVYQEWMPGAE